MVSQFKLAGRIDNLHPSPIREILKIIEKPGMISFAGGLPSIDSFPHFNAEIPARYLQYGPSEGEPELRTQLTHVLAKRGLRCDTEQVLILSGSQQGIDLVAKLLIEKNSTIAIESPTYLAALQVYNLYGARYQSILQLNSDTALVYAIPTFQNPTGHCYSEQARLELARRCDQYHTILFEDDPYSDLVYEPVCQTPVCSMMEKSEWIYQGSFSKSLSPGLRLGYMVCSKALIPYLTRLKQAADLHSSRISQFHVLNSITDSEYDNRLLNLQKTYRHKRDLFARTLEQYFDKLASWELPAGGLFFWLILNSVSEQDTRILFEKAIKNNVAFMPGQYFYPDIANPHTMRLNFSHASVDEIHTGLSILSRLIQKQNQLPLPV